MIEVSIVGCGYWGVNYVRVFNELPNATVTRVCDQRLERLDFTKQRHPFISTHTTLSDLLQDTHMSAVVVSTPTSSHYEIAKACLQAGKHVLVEKPLTTTAEHCEELIQLAAEAERVLMVGHTFLYNAGIRKFKELVSGEEFGRMYYLHATRTNLGPIRQDVNAVWDLAPHDISIFDYLLGTLPTHVSAVGSKLLENGWEDVAFITLTYPNDVIGNIHVSWADPNKVREIVAVGSSRRIVFDDMNNLERIRVFEKGVAPQQEAGSFGEYRLLMRDGDIISPKVEPSEPLKNQALHFLDCIEKGQVPLTDGQNGLDVVRVLVAINESLEKGGVPVEVR
jgi:predicted dehydrogenase